VFFNIQRLMPSSVGRVGHSKKVDVSGSTIRQP